MKRVNGLYKKMCNEDNIRLAFGNAKKGKRHYKEVQIIESNLEHYINELKQLLENKTYCTSKYKRFTKKSGEKVREIYKLPYYPDRIVHHCIIQVVQKLWMSLLIRDTFSTIPGRGIHDGVSRIKKAVLNIEETKYCLKIDIEKYYPSIDHGILKKIIRRKIKDQFFLNLTDSIIDSAQGIPIGNYVSQWFGNLYLAYFDHYCKEKLNCKYYYRYCDDIVILSNDKSKLRLILNEMQFYLKDELKLDIKDNYQIFPIASRGLDFLGYRFFHGYTLVRKRIVKAMKKKQNSPKSMASYWGWVKHADTYYLTQKYFKDERKFA